MGVRYCDFKDLDRSDFDAVVVGSGFAGAVAARELAERGGARVLVIEKRSHIGGNMYDELDEAGVLVHRYGPHIFHTNDKRAFDYVRRFTEWRDYEHEVLADWYGTYLPVPFNKNSMEIAFGEERAAHLTQKLIDAFGDERKVTITELREQDDPELSEIADFVYRNVFLYYTQKQWGLTPEEVDPSVTARVPVFVSRDNRYFQDAYQGMPAEGYTPLFERMLESEGILVCLNTEAESVFDLEFASGAEDAPLSAILIKGAPFQGPIVYTGPLDELFLSRFGRLPYRSLEFAWETHDVEHVLPCGTVNFTVTEDYTRITEFKHLTGQAHPKTTIMKEYSRPYEDPLRQIPYYAILSDENRAHYERYRALTAPLANFHPLGRLAEYRYYNMDVIIGRALALADELVPGLEGRR
ncbi:UDP-galactopyranose mutase [Rubneribacter badeniensis]|uniref:UDP-galactopyranose mutase n=1 Tax=Rubneribacter badeniensis TaxID=2070688 RepID=A0A2K2U8E1_9ACTN|nr:UDP-galactopyranose mutase [Rubneribacter badeniensis]OUO95653.1 UDP-galactopyranose mutase [Gordonibacter sp. An232A]PNV66529.1 UDP-galactopyranose mutase [Rubneribacter badeniensis]